MIKFYSKVAKVERRKRIARAWKTGKKLEDGVEEIRYETEDLGWYMLLEGSRESLFIGSDEDPGFKKGDKVEVTIRATI